jgi:heme/copper-type cytochrome/quinol oxidase subunit 1
MTQMVMVSTLLVHGVQRLALGLEIFQEFLAQTKLYGLLHLNTTFFDPAGGGDPVLFQHLFWLCAYESAVFIYANSGTIVNLFTLFVSL